MIPASRTEPIVGASVCASGSHGVERPHRHLDREPQRDRAEHDQLERLR
jgi:hypothetical protein